MFPIFNLYQENNVDLAERHQLNNIIQQLKRNIIQLESEIFILKKQEIEDAITKPKAIDNEKTYTTEVKPRTHSAWRPEMPAEMLAEMPAEMLTPRPAPEMQADSLGEGVFSHSSIVMSKENPLLVEKNQEHVFKMDIAKTIILYILSTSALVCLSYLRYRRRSIFFNSSNDVDSEKLLGFILEKNSVLSGDEKLKLLSAKEIKAVRNLLK